MASELLARAPQHNVHDAMAEYQPPGTPGQTLVAGVLEGAPRRGSDSSRGSSRRSGDEQRNGGVSEGELEDDLKNLLRLMDESEEAVEKQQQERRAKKKKKRHKTGPLVCSGAWWGARKRRPLTLAILNNLFLVIVGFYGAAWFYGIDTDAEFGTLDVRAVRADGLEVYSARPVVLKSSSVTSATVRAPAGQPTVVRLGESTLGSLGHGRGLAIEPGGESWAGGAPGPGGMLAIGDVGGEEGGLDMTLTSENGAVRVGPFVLQRDMVQNTDGDLVLQTGGGSGGLLMLAPDGKVATDANVTVAGSLHVDGLTADAVNNSVRTRDVLLHAQVYAHRGVTVNSGDLTLQEGYFVTDEGIDLNLNGSLVVGGSVTIARPNPETSNRTGGNLSVVGALRVRGQRGVHTSTFDATGRHLHSVGAISVEGQANFSGNVRLGYGPGSSLEIMSETTHLDTFTTRSFTTLGSAERLDADISFHTGSFAMMSTLGADAFRVHARADEPEIHGVVTRGSFDGLGNFTCPSSVILGDENSDSITVRGLLTLYDQISCGRSLTVEGPAHIGSPELPVGWTAESLECSQGLQAIIRGWELSPRLKLVRTETVTFNMLAERPVGPRRIEFGANTRDSWGIYRAQAVITGDVSAYNLTVGGETRWGGSASVGGDLSIRGETVIGGALRLGSGLHMVAGKTAQWRGQLTFQTNSCDGNNPTPLVLSGSPATQRQCEATGYSWDGASCSAGSAVNESSCISTGNVWTAGAATAQVSRRSGDMTIRDLSVGQDVLLSEATIVQGDVTVAPTDPAQLGLILPRLEVGQNAAFGASLSIGKNFNNGGSLSSGGSAVVVGGVNVVGDFNSTGSLFFINGTGASQFIADVHGDMQTVGSLYIGGDTIIGRDVEFGKAGGNSKWTLNASIAYVDPLEIHGSVTTVGDKTHIGSGMLRSGLALYGALIVPHRPAVWPTRANGEEPIYDICHIDVALEKDVEQYAITGIVHDGSWGYAYEHHTTDTDCQRLLQAPAGYLVRLTFLEWDLRDQHDYLRIFDGDSLAHPRIGAFDGHDAVENGTVYSSGRHMLLNFHVEQQPARVPQLHPETNTWVTVPPPPPTNTGWSARYTFIPSDVPDISVDVKTVLTVSTRVEVNEERCQGVDGRDCEYSAASGVGADQDTCVASSLRACESVVLDGDEATCTQAGKCAYTAEVIERCVPTDAEACASAALDGTGVACLAAGACTYTAPDANDPDVVESCTATAATTAIAPSGAVSVVTSSPDIPGGPGTFTSADINANGIYAAGDRVVIADQGAVGGCDRNVPGSYIIDSIVDDLVVFTSVLGDGSGDAVTIASDCTIERHEVVCADAVLNENAASCHEIGGPAGSCTYFAPVAEDCEATDKTACAAERMLSHEEWLIWQQGQQLFITPTVDGACEFLPPAGSFIECAGRCIPQPACKLGEDVCHSVAPYGRFTSCGFGQCVLGTECPVFEPPAPPSVPNEEPPRIIDLKGSFDIYSQRQNISVYRVVNRDPVAEEDLPPDFLCIETPDGWTDRLGLSCATYVTVGWCADPSDEGIGQLGAPTATFPSGMEDSNGIGAQMACCLCGGGTRPPPEELVENATVITEGSVTIAGDLFANSTSVERIEIRGARGRPDTKGLAFIDVLDRHTAEPTPEVCERNRCTGYVQGTGAAPSTTCPAGCTLGGTCTTTEVPACAGANADAVTCTGAGACSFSAGAPNTCSTTVVSACASANADEPTCTAAGACSFTETCTATVTDCATDYVPGDVANPSSTCPIGCVFTPAAHRTLDIIAGGKVSAQLRDGGFISIGVNEMRAESRADGVTVDGVVVRSGTIIQRSEGKDMELHTHYGLQEDHDGRVDPIVTRVGRPDGESRPDGLFDMGVAGRRRLQYRRPSSALRSPETHESCVLRTACTEDPCLVVGYPFVSCSNGCVPIGHCVDPCHHLGEDFVVCLPVQDPERLMMLLDCDFAAFQADPSGFVNHFEQAVAKFLSLRPSRVVVSSVVPSSVMVIFSILPLSPGSGEPSLDVLIDTLYESINTGVADDLFSDEHTAVIGHALEFSAEARERPQPYVQPGSAIMFKQFLDLPTDYITWEDDECHSNPCANGATCHDELYAYFCDCAPGWDGENCVEERIACEDDENPCQPVIEAPAGMRGISGARCTHAGPGVRLCACYYGYEGDGFSCVDIDECLSAPCNNGGSCVNLVGEYTCTCQSGFMGPQCDYATHVDMAKIVDRPPANLAGLLASDDPETIANGLSAELAFFTTDRGTVTEQLKIGEDGHLVAAQGQIRSTENGLAVDGNIFVEEASGPSLVEVSSLADSATLSVSTGGSVGAAIQYGPDEDPRFYMRVRASPGPFDYDTVVTPDSCTSTLVALPSTVTAADTVNCVLAASVDFGVTPGSCAAVDASVSTCNYVRGTYSDSNAPPEELSLSGDVETFRVTKRATPGNIQDFVGDISLFGDGTVGRVPNPSLLTEVIPTDPNPDTTYHANYATANSGALREPKVYPRTIVKDCFIGGHQRNSDHRVAVPADESCTVDFSGYLMVGESLEGADVSITIQGDFDDAGEAVDSVTADGVEVASSCVSNDGSTRVDPWSNIERTGPFSDCDDDGFHTCLQSVDVPITGCVATHIGACGALGSSGTESGDDCTADDRCVYRDQGTGPTCVASFTDACAATTGRFECEMAGWDNRCTYNTQGTLATCALAADIVSTCAAITGRTDCNNHASCTFDGSLNACLTTTTASECTDAASGGATACTDAGDCTYDDGLADDVCEATDHLACAAAAGNNAAACTAAGKCTYDSGISDDVCEAVDLALCAAEASNGDLSCMSAGACSTPHAADGAVAITVHVSSKVNYCALAAHAKVSLHLLVRGADHCASNPCPISSIDNPILSQDFVCYSGLDSYECLPPSKISIRSATTAGLLFTGHGDSALKITSGYNRDPKIELLDVWEPGSFREGYNIFLDGSQNAQECRNVPFGAADAGASQRELHETCENILLSIQLTATDAEPEDVSNPCRSPRFADSLPNCAWTCAIYPHCERSCDDFSDCACGYCDSGEWPSLRMGREADTSKPTFFSIVDTGDYGSVLLNGDLEVGRPSQAAPARMTVKSSVSAHLSSMSLHEDSFVQVIPGSNQMGAVIFGDKTDWTTGSIADAAYLLFNEGKPGKFAPATTESCTSIGAPDTVDTPDSCTSVLISDGTVATMDNVNCLLTETVDFGLTPGSCANVDIAYSCAYVAGSYSATGDAVTRKDTKNCVLTQGLDPMGVPDGVSGSCAVSGAGAAVVPLPVTCTYVPTADAYRVDDCTTWHSSIVTCAERNRPTLNFASGPRPDTLVTPDSCTSSSVADGTLTTSDIDACVLTPTTDFGITPGSCLAVDAATATCIYIPGEFSASGVPNSVDVADSCTSTMLSGISETDTILCTLTGTSDFGVTPGWCAAVGASATCTYIAGQYSDTDNDGAPDHEDTADSCTATLVSATKTFDTAKCVLTGTPDFGVTPGSCAAVDSSTAICAYVAGEFSAYLRPIVKVVSYPEGVQESCVPEVTNPITTCSLNAAIKANPLANPPVVGAPGSCTITAGLGPCHYVEAVDGLGLLHTPGFARFGDLETPSRPETCRPKVGTLHEDYNSDVLTCGSVDLTSDDKPANRLACLSAGTGSECEYTAPSSGNSVTVQSAEEATLQLLSKDVDSVVRVMSAGPTEIGVREDPTGDNSGGWYLRKGYGELTDDDPWPKLLLTADDDELGISDTIVTLERVEDTDGTCVDAFGATVSAANEADCLGWDPDHDGDGEGDGTDGPGVWTPYIYGMMTLNGDVTFGTSWMPPRTLTVQGESAELRIQVENLDAAINIRGGEGEQAIVDFTDVNGGSISIISQQMFGLGSDLMVRDGTALGGLVERWPLEQLAASQPYRVVSFNTGVGAARLPVATMVNQRKFGVLLIQGTPTFGTPDLEMECSVSVKSLLRADVHIASSLHMDSTTPSDAVLQITSVERPSLVVGSVVEQQFFRISVDTDEEVPTLLISDAVADEDSPLFSVTSGPFTLDVDGNQIPVPPLVGKLYVSGHGQIGSSTSAGRNLLVQTTGDGGQAELGIISGEHSPSTLNLISTGRFSERAIFQDKPDEVPACTGVATTPSCAYSAGTRGCPVGCNDNGVTCTGVATTPTCDLDPSTDAIADSCTSTRLATVTAADTVLCTLTGTSDFGITPGSCDNVDASATCAYIAGQYSDTDSDGSPDSEDIADSCTSTLLAMVTADDTTNCVLTGTPNFGVTPGSCAAVDSSTATCAYVAGTYSTSCPAGCSYQSVSSTFELRPAWSSNIQCTGTAAQVPATCGSGQDDDGNVCAVDGTGTACLVDSGTCSFVAAYIPSCDTDVATDGTATCLPGCVRGTVAPWSIYIPDVPPAGQDFLSIIGNKHSATSMLDIRRTIRTDSSGEPVATADIFVNGDGTIGWVPPTILEACVATDPSNADDVADCGTVVVSGVDDLMDQQTCRALVSTVDGRDSICTYIEASDWDAVDIDFTLQSESTSISLLSGGSTDAVLQVTAGAARDAYLTLAREEGEACRAIDLTSLAAIMECAAVDVSGLDAAADQAACEATGTGSVCAYVAQGTLSSYFLQKSITCPSFTKIEDSQIVGSEFTREELTGSVRDCEEACCIRYWCKTFDYQKAQGYCQLLDVHKDENPQTQGLSAFMGPSTGMYSLTEWDHYEKVYGTSELRFGSQNGHLGTLTAGSGDIYMLTDFAVGSSTSSSSSMSLESADEVASVAISSTDDDALLLMSSHSDAKSTLEIVRGDTPAGPNSHSFELTKTGRHGCVTGYFECGNSDCIPMVDVCDGVETLRVVESCVATDPTNAVDVATCANVDIQGNDMCDANGNVDAVGGAFLCDEQACDSWQVCTYTAGIQLVTVQSCIATDLEACAAVETDAMCYDSCLASTNPCDSTCQAACNTDCERSTTQTLCEAAGQCSYSPDDPNTIMIDDTCTASSKLACEAVAQTGGDKATCESAGHCTYKPADCSDGSDEGWATCAGYGPYTQSAMDTLGMGGLISDYGVVPTPFVVSEVSAQLSLTTDSGANEMISVLWSPELAAHRLRVSRDFTARGGLNLQSLVAKSSISLGNGLEDAVELRGALVQSELRVYPTNDPDDVTTTSFRLRLPDPDPPTADQVSDGITETEFVQTFPALSAELQAEGRPLESVLLTDRSAYSQLKQVDVLRSGSIADGFGSISAASITTEVELTAAGALISQGTAWISAGCMPPVNGEEGCTPVESLLKLGDGHEDELSFPGTVQSQVILQPERSDNAPPNLYIPPITGLIAGVSESCYARDTAACAEVVLDGVEATCTGAGVCTYTPTAAESCAATDAAACGAVDLNGNGNDASTCTDVIGPSGNACVHTPSTDPNGFPDDGDETPESCAAQDDVLCSSKTLTAGDPTSCEATGGGDCTWSAATTESCVATDLDACAAIDAAVPNGDPAPCLSASSPASAARLAAGNVVCVYTPGTTSCVGTAPSATGCVCNYEPVDCASALVPGNAATCISAFGGACTYTPDSLATTANEEECAPTKPGACTVDIFDHDVDLANVNKIGWRSESLLTTDSKQYFLTAVFDPISEFSLGGSRELFIDDHGLPGHPASILWVGKPTTPQRIPAGATTLVSPYTAGLIEGDATTLAAGASFSLTVTNPLLNADSLVYVTNVDDTYSASNTNNRFQARPYRNGLTINAALYPEAARPTLFHYVEVSAGQFTLTVQNADDFDATATSIGYAWKVSWVAFI